MSHHCCRHLSLLERLDREALLLSPQAAPAADGSRGFRLPQDEPQWSRPRPFAIEHLRAELELELAARAIEAHAVLRVRRVDAEAGELLLDAIDFELREVTLDGAAARYRYDGRVLAIEVDPPAEGSSPEAEPARTHTVGVRYRAVPERGLYFITAAAPRTAPDPSALPTEVWSQGQDEDNRAWLPLVDHPGERMTTELVAHVPAGWFALSNGVLVERSEDAKGAVFHWRQDQAHASYLITLACGRFDEAHAKHGELPVDYYVPVGQGADIPRSLGKTPEMIALFERRFGTRFPWAKYAQIVVHDFIFGGMENTSATTLYDRALVDERAALDVDVESLVAHELAHQWFGDLVTCRHWSHAWLNEGFATYCEHLWREHASGEDEYLLGLEHDQDAYLDEDRDHYRRPIVTNVWAKPIDIFDRHLYQKGGLVLHALRRHLGDEAFFRGVGHYLEVMGGKSAETRDLHRAIEDATGRSLEAFFDQWVLRAGHPTLEVSSAYEDGVLRVTVAQSASDPLFDVSLPIDVVRDGETRRVVLHVTRARESFVVACPSAPSMVLLDPEMCVVGVLDNRLSTALLVEQIAHAKTARPRWRAARALAKRNEPRARAALVRALSEDPFWGVRLEAAQALGEQRTSDALTALLDRLASKGEADARARRAVVRAIGQFERDARAASALVAGIEQGDRSYLVEGELRRSLGRTRDPRAFDVLVRCLERDPVAWGDAVRQGAVDGLSNLRDVRALPLLRRALGPGEATPVRRSAMLGLAKMRSITSEEPRLVETREAIVYGLDAFDPGVRSLGARALAALRDPGSFPALERLVTRDLDGRVRRSAREASRDLREALAKGVETTALRDDLDKLRAELTELRGQLAALSLPKESLPKE